MIDSVPRQQLLLCKLPCAICCTLSFETIGRRSRQPIVIFFFEDRTSSIYFSCFGRGEKECRTFTDEKPPRSLSCSSSRSPGRLARLLVAHSSELRTHSYYHYTKSVFIFLPSHQIALLLPEIAWLTVLLKVRLSSQLVVFASIKYLAAVFKMEISRTRFYLELVPLAHRLILCNKDLILIKLYAF